MANTYSQIYIQVVFAVKHRKCLIQPEWEDELYKFISGIVRKKEQKLIAVNGMPDHIHFLLGMKPACCLSDLVREVKKSSNEFINEKKFSPFKFDWQVGFGAFSYGQSQLDMVIAYIAGQKQHHRKQTFREEYIGLLKKFNIEHEEQFLFDWLD
jgi:REP element-mobilizing transposase RayT